MEEKDYSRLVPGQKTGVPIDTESFVELDNEDQARAFFGVVTTRLKNVNRWHEMAGNLSARFQLVNKDGVEVQRSAQKGDYFKIDIPGPGTVSGEGYDWVQIEEVESITTPEMESFGFRVRPTQNPQNKKDIAHFFSPESTSNFIVTREGNKIIAGIYDRNTKPNKDADSIIDKVRDTVIGIAGVLGFAKIQWKMLTDALLDREK